MAMPTAPTHVSAVAYFTTDATPTPYVVVYWDNDTTIDNYTIYRDGTNIAVVNPAAAPLPTNAYQDNGVTAGSTHNYTVQGRRGGVYGPGTVYGLGIPLYPAAYVPPVAAPLSGTLTRWTFTDVYQKGITPYVYAMQVNPNDGGSPTFEKQVQTLKVSGPNEMPLIQEGSPGASTMAFSGIILSQQQLETMEIWFRKKILILIQDDLGRKFYGVFSHWTPTRSRRSSNAWYHTYQASMEILAYYNASGQRIFGRFL